MAYDVKVKIDLAKPSGTAGFGVPLILVENASAEVAYTEVAGLDDVVTAGFAATTDAYKLARLIFAQDNAPAQIALCASTGTAIDALADVALLDRDWRQLLVISEGGTASAVADISALVEQLDGKIYFANLDVDSDTSLSVEGLNRTVLFYCTATEDAPLPVAALVGEAAGRAAGSFTYKNLKLTGIAPQVLTDDEISAIHAKGGLTFVTKAGDNVTSEGKTAGGEYIDIIDSQDYIIQQLKYRTQKQLNSVDKVSYDDSGIALLESVALEVLQGAYNDGMIATDEDGNPAYAVYYALRAQTSEVDRAARRYLGGTFSFQLAGAIHQVEITGSITV